MKLKGSDILMRLCAIKLCRTFQNKLPYISLVCRFSKWIMDERRLQKEMYPIPRRVRAFLGKNALICRPCRPPTRLRLYLSHNHSYGQPSQLQLLLAHPQAQSDGSRGGGRGGWGLRPAPTSPTSTVPHRLYAAGQPAPLSHLLQFQRLQTQLDHPSVFTQWTLPVLWTL